MRIWHLSDCAECAERGDVERRGVLFGEVCCREREGQSLGNFLVFAKHLSPRRHLQGKVPPTCTLYLRLTFTCSSLFSVQAQREMNVSATVNVLRLLVNPSLCLPHHTIATFDQLPVPLSQAFTKNGSDKKPDIKAVVLDKDNCFALPKTNVIHKPYIAKFEELRTAYPGSKILIVSNSSGTNSDPQHAEADVLEQNTGIKVLRHSTKKPGCHSEIMEYFRSHPDTGVSHESQIAIVGDRLFTDILMANMMGSYGVWIENGVKQDYGFVSHS